MSGISQGEQLPELAPSSVWLLIAPFASGVAVAAGTLAYHFTDSHLWSVILSFVSYVIATITFVNIMHSHSLSNTRIYLSGVAVFAILLISLTWLWLGSEGNLAWLGSFSEEFMKYIGVWLTSADGPLLVSIIIWFGSFFAFSFIGYFLGEALYDARH